MARLPPSHVVDINVSREEVVLFHLESASIHEKSSHLLSKYHSRKLLKMFVIYL